MTSNTSHITAAVRTIKDCDDHLTRLSGDRATALATGELAKVMRLDLSIDRMLDRRTELRLEQAANTHQHQAA